jgi:hypothetical protein
MKTPDQPPLPFTPGPLDFTQPVKCAANQLCQVIAKAQAAGFSPFSMTAVSNGLYKLEFRRDEAAISETGAPETSKESLENQPSSKIAKAN